MISRTRDETIAKPVGKADFLLIVLSVLLPPVGLLIGGIFHSKDDEGSKDFGRWCFAAAILGLIVITIMIVGLWAINHKGS